MFEWVEILYARVRGLMPLEQRASLDSALEHGGYGVVFGDSLVVAARNQVLTGADKAMAEKVLDFGLLRKAKPYFMELMAG